MSAGAMAETAPADGIEGERGRANVQRGASLRGRLQAGLAILVIVALTGGFLYWWYARLAAERAAGEAKPARVRGGEGEYVLPALGRVDAPWLDRLPKLPFTGDPAVLTTKEAVALAQGSDAPAAGAGASAEEPLSERAARAEAARRARGSRAGSGGDAAAGRSGARRAGGGAASADRRLGAPVMWRREAGGMRAVGAPGGAGAGLSVMELDPMGLADSRDDPPAAGDSGLTSALRATGTPPTRAAQLPEPSAWLPKGAFLDCTLETAIDSTLPGLATCVLAHDVYGADGSRVLLRRGTRLVGEVRTATRTTQKRVFVLWQEARTPEGVLVPLASPATDALGRSGIEGDVDRHFLARFGAAFLVSVIDAAVQQVAISGRGDGSNVVINPRGTGDVAAEILRDTIRIPPTIRVPQGARVQVLVARHVDFRGVLDSLGGVP